MVFGWAIKGSLGDDEINIWDSWDHNRLCYGEVIRCISMEKYFRFFWGREMSIIASWYLFVDGEGDLVEIVCVWQWFTYESTHKMCYYMLFMTVLMDVRDGPTRMGTPHARPRSRFGIKVPCIKGMSVLTAFFVSLGNFYFVEKHQK